MKTSKKILSIIIILLLLLIISIINIYNKNDNDNTFTNNIEIIEGDNNVLEDIKVVTNPHMYFTVKSCIEKYISYISQGDNESVYKILDNEYIIKFNISEENIFNIIETTNNPFTISIEKMYFKENNNIQEYYVSAILIEEDMNGEVIKEKEFKITVKLDINNMIYSVIPNGYGGPLYEEN